MSSRSPTGLIKPYNSDAISIVTNFAKLFEGEQALLLGKEGKNPDDYLESMGRLYHFIHEEKPYFKERITPRDFFRVFVVEPQQSFERIRAQSGAFLISAFHERFERHEIRKCNAGTPLYGHFMLRVPHVRKKHILDELRLLNITRETLFPRPRRIRERDHTTPLQTLSKKRRGLMLLQVFQMAKLEIPSEKLHPLRLPINGWEIRW